MPYSDATLRPWTLSALQNVLGLDTILRVVDVGAGAGTNLDFYAPWMPHSSWTAIEVWHPYIERFALDDRYADVICADVRSIDLPEADLYVLGDVMEHLPKADAVALWERVQAISRAQILSVPIVHYEQGTAFGNPHEAHLHHWKAAEVRADLGGIVMMNIGKVVGSFVAVSPR